MRKKIQSTGKFCEAAAFNNCETIYIERAERISNLLSCAGISWPLKFWIFIFLPNENDSCHSARVTSPSSIKGCENVLSFSSSHIFQAGQTDPLFFTHPAADHNLRRAHPIFGPLFLGNHYFIICSFLLDTQVLKVWNWMFNSSSTIYNCFLSLFSPDWYQQLADTFPHERVHSTVGQFFFRRPSHDQLDFEAWGWKLNSCSTIYNCFLSLFSPDWYQQLADTFPHERVHSTVGQFFFRRPSHDQLDFEAWGWKLNSCSTIYNCFLSLFSPDWYQQLADTFPHERVHSTVGQFFFRRPSHDQLDFEAWAWKLNSCSTINNFSSIIRTSHSTRNFSSQAAIKAFLLKLINILVASFIFFFLLI